MSKKGKCDLSCISLLMAAHCSGVGSTPVGLWAQAVAWQQQQAAAGAAAASTGGNVKPAAAWAAAAVVGLLGSSTCQGTGGRSCVWQFASCGLLLPCCCWSWRAHHAAGTHCHWAPPVNSDGQQVRQKHDTQSQHLTKSRLLALGMIGTVSCLGGGVDVDGTFPCRKWHVTC